MVTMVVAVAPAVACGAAAPGEPYLSVLLMTTLRPRPTMYAVPAWSCIVQSAVTAVALEEVMRSESKYSPPAGSARYHSMEAKPEGPAWDALREALARMQRIAESDSVHLVDLGKAYAALASAMLGAAEASGQTSARFRAVVRALDLRASSSPAKKPKAKRPSKPKSA